MFFIISHMSAQSKSVWIYLFVAFFAITAGACSTGSPHLHSSLQNPALWSYGHDPYGSSVTIGDKLIRDGAARIEFNRAARVADDKNTWIELIYHAPEGNLNKVKAVRITYQCSDELWMKFSQSDFGEDGDGSYAHYQSRLPAAEDWKTVEVSLQDFSRPAWTPASSKDVGLILANVSAIYLAPALDDLTGGQALLNVRAIDLVY